MGVCQVEREDVADALCLRRVESKVRFDCIGEYAIRGHAVEQLRICKVQLYSIANRQKIARILLVSTVVVILLAGEERKIIISSREYIGSSLLHVQQPIGYVSAVDTGSG